MNKGLTPPPLPYCPPSGRPRLTPLATWHTLRTECGERGFKMGEVDLSHRDALVGCGVHPVCDGEQLGGRGARRGGVGGGRAACWGGERARGGGWWRGPPRP